MRVAYFCRTEIPSGTANSLHIMKFCAALTRQKVQVDLHVFQRRGVEISEDVFEFYQVSERFNIIWHDILPGIGKFEYLTAILRVGWAVRSIIQQKGYQIFYGRDLTSLFFAALFDKRPIFIESHAPLWLSKSEKIFFWICLRLQRVSRLVVISNALASVYLEKFPDLAGRILVLPDGADRVPSRSPKKTVARIQNRYGTELVVGYTGSLYRGKGLEIISQIAPALPEVAFHIVGGSATDCEYWRSRITENNVLFYGFRKQQEVSLMIDEMDVCLLPNQEYSVGYRAGLGQAANLSKFTSPMKLFEYMASGKAIVASDLPVLREILNEKTALFAIPDDVDAWVAALQQLKNPAIREGYGMRARRCFEANYTWDHRARKLLSCFNPRKT